MPVLAGWGCFLTPDLIDGETGAVVDSLDGILGAAWFGDALAYVASDGSLGLFDLSNGTGNPSTRRACQSSVRSSTRRGPSTILLLGRRRDELSDGCRE